MIPAKEKAIELVNKMDGYVHYALIAVDEILEDRERLDDAFFYDGNYWQEVKQEIELL